jgi:hypothetical protein
MKADGDVSFEQLKRDPEFAEDGADATMVTPRAEMAAAE